LYVSARTVNTWRASIQCAQEPSLPSHAASSCTRMPSLAATGVKVQVLYQVIEPLNDLIYKILLSPAVSWPQQRLLRLQVLSALENSSHFPRRNNPTDQLIGYSRSYCSLEQRSLFLTRRRTSVSTPLLPSIVAFASQVQASPHHAERRHKHLLCQDLDRPAQRFFFRLSTSRLLLSVLDRTRCRSVKKKPSPPSTTQETKKISFCRLFPLEHLLTTTTRKSTSHDLPRVQALYPSLSQDAPLLIFLQVFGAAKL
jgi:hypothetical protein